MERRDPNDRAEFVILTGSLGSGKTTLLVDYLSTEVTSETGVIINDAGEVNVDGAIIGTDYRNLSLAELSDGCICCSLGNGVQQGIDALLRARAERSLGPPRRIILETSGLAEPGPLVRSLREVRQMAFDLRIVGTFDASRPHIGDDFLPQYAAQLAVAQTIVLTKLDVTPSDRWLARARDARRFNPFAIQVTESEPVKRARAAFSKRQLEHAPRASQFSTAAASSSRITVACARWDPNATWDEICEWIENMTGFLGSRLLRLKGLLRPAGFTSPVLINGIAEALAPPRLVRVGDDAMLGLIMILRDVTKDELSITFGLPSTPELKFQ